MSRNRQGGKSSASSPHPPAFRLKPLAVAIIAAHSPLALVAQEQTEEEESGRTIEEVIVTATKREANMQDVAQSITAFTTDDLERLRARDMKEYIDALPSVALVNSVPGRNSVVFRGVSTGSSEYRTDSMTAVYLDEQPLTTNSQQVDPWLVDIERVEALPGPQGTLFGSSSQSGTLRVITNKPDPSGFGAQIDAGAYSTRGGEPSYDLSGHLNIPLADRFALRVAAFVSHEGGYVDNVLGRDLADTRDNADVVEDDFNEYEVSGGRVAASWELGDRWSVIAGIIAQNSSATGAWESDPNLGDFKVVKFFDEYRDDDWSQHSITIKGDLGAAEFSATTAIFDRDIAYEWDNHVYEQYKDAYWGVYSGYGLYNSEYTFGTIFNDQTQERFSQEVRLTSTGASRFQWMVGAFYEDVDDEWFYGAQNPSLMDTVAWETANYYAYTYYAAYDHIDYPLPASDIGYFNHFIRAVKQTAAFGELVYDFSDRLTTTVGLRWFEYDRNEYDQFHFPHGLPPLSALDSNGAYGSSGVEQDTALKLSAQYTLDSDRMVYFLFSQGFRLGGSNSQRAAATGLVPQNYGADILNNYEGGLKSEWFDNRLQLNVSAFYMVWEDIQIDNAGGVEDKWWLRGMINGDTARTMGVEVTWDASISDSLRFEGSVFLADPEFNSEFTLLSGEQITDGTTMPISPEFKYYFAVEYTFWNWRDLGDLWVRYDTSHQSEVYNGLSSAIAEDPEGKQPSWTLSNFQLGIELPDGPQFMLEVYNVWDERTINYLDNGGNFQAAQFGDPRFHNIRSYVAPRSIGLSATFRF
ncbi:MAG: TonB-dependent receptor [Gammaproteobacteria bacterium]|nr:TonB-dependent receptor [Gammaproteobacteria bacterium]